MKRFEKLPTFSQIVSEAKRPDQKDIYYDTYSAAVQFARSETEKRGYLIDEDDWFRNVNSGPKKPSEGDTNRLQAIGLTMKETGKPAKKALHIQVYNRGTDKGTYELNWYLS